MNFNPIQIEAMERIAAAWIFSNLALVDSARLTFKSVGTQNEFEKSLTHKRIQQSINKELAAQQLFPGVPEYITTAVFRNVTDLFDDALYNEVISKINQREQLSKENV